MLYVAIIDDLFYAWELSGEDGSSADSYYDMIDYHYDKLTEDIWKEYYSPEFLRHPTSAQFYRLPNLRDLPNGHGPVGALRTKGIGNHKSLPRWAHHVYRTMIRQPNIPLDTMVQLAMSTLRATKQRQQKDCPRAQPYSDTHAWFWLNRHINDLCTFLRRRTDHETLWKPDMYSCKIAQGDVDVWHWQQHYSSERWAEAAVSEMRLEPDLDGTPEPDILGCEWPEDGVIIHGMISGWEPEVGSEEEVAFATAVAVKETEGVPLDALNYSMRSHILLAILHIAFIADDKEKHIESVKQRMVQAGRIEEDKVDDWVRQALALMEPYAAQEDYKWSEGADRDQLLQQALLNNAQLFARWGWMYGRRMTPRAAMFDLGPSRPKQAYWPIFRRSDTIYFEL